MLKSRVFTFNEHNLLKDIDTYRMTTGKEPKELQGNCTTINLWVSLIQNELKYPVIHNNEDKDKHIIGWYDGIPITINEFLDDGTINIV